jgi:integrase
MSLRDSTHLPGRVFSNVPMTARVHELIQNHNNKVGKPDVGYLFPNDKSSNDPVSYDSIKARHDLTMRSLPTLKRFRLYDLPHTLLTRLGESNADAFAIQKIAGHYTITVSQRYVHPTPERVEEAFSRLEIYNARKIDELKSKRKAEEDKSRVAVPV